MEFRAVSKNKSLALEWYGMKLLQTAKSHNGNFYFVFYFSKRYSLIFRSVASHLSTLFWV
jgi:hypothetical protein